MKHTSLGLLALVLAPFLRAAEPAAVLPRLAHNDPGLLVDLGVGLWAWPLPMDYNGDGLMDLVYAGNSPPGIVFVRQTEPGTFKDREILERNPFQLLEGVAICAYAARAATAFTH